MLVPISTFPLNIKTMITPKAKTKAKPIATIGRQKLKYPSTRASAPANFTSPIPRTSKQLAAIPITKTLMQQRKAKRKRAQSIESMVATNCDKRAIGQVGKTNLFGRRCSLRSITASGHATASKYRAGIRARASDGLGTNPSQSRNKNAS